MTHAITQSEATDKVVPALVEVQNAVLRVGKSGNNTFDKYKYATLEDYEAAIAPFLTQQGLAIVESVVDVTPVEGGRTTSNGKQENATYITLQIMALHSSGQWVCCYVGGEGQDRGDKGIYKAITGARKYGRACLFNLVTSDDPERDTPPADTKKPPRASQPSEPIVENADKNMDF